MIILNGQVIINSEQTNSISIIAKSRKSSMIANNRHNIDKLHSLKVNLAFFVLSKCTCCIFPVKEAICQLYKKQSGEHFASYMLKFICSFKWLINYSADNIYIYINNRHGENWSKGCRRGRSKQQSTVVQWLPYLYYSDVIKSDE